MFTLNAPKFINPAFFISFAILLPVWNLPHTIFLRYLCALVLLAIVILSKPKWAAFFKKNIFLCLLFFYILVQLIFFSTDYSLAFRNFKSEWLKFILFAITGIGCGYILSTKQMPRIHLYLGILFFIPLFIHLCVSLIKGISTGQIPVSYWGINNSHGDLGYTSIHVAVFLSVYLFFQAKSSLTKILISFLLIASIVSLLIASSRGGILFFLASFILILLIKIFKLQRTHFSFKSIVLSILGVFILIGSIFQIGTYLDPIRWRGPLSNMEIAFKGDALKINCEGIDVLKRTLEQDGMVITPAIQKTLDAINGFDGARILALRSLPTMFINHPMGMNQSRFAYATALEEICGAKPQIGLMNSHNGWADTALSIGIIGALLYFLVLCKFIYEGLSALKHKDPLVSATGVALFALGLIWVLRSMFDSAQRDQMLEMQIFTLCVLSAFIFFQQQRSTKVVLD